MAKITQINDGDSGLVCKNKLNQALSSVEVDGSVITGTGNIGDPVTFNPSQVDPSTLPIDPIPNITGSDLQTVLEYIEGSLISNKFKDIISDIVIIQSEADFPNQDANNIYGQVGHMYYIVKPFTTAKKFIGNNCIIRGITTIINMWEYTGTGYAIENLLGARMSIYDINISADNGTVFHVQGNNTGNITERINIDNVFLTGKRIADINGAGGFVLSTASVIGVNTPTGDLINLNSTGMTLFSMQRVLGGGVPSGGSIINLNSTTAQEYEISDLIYSGASSGYVFKGLSNGANVLSGGQFTCSGGNFLGSTTPLLNITPSDIRVTFRDNIGVDDSTFSADTYLSTQRTVPITTSGSYVVINGTNWTTTLASKLSVSNQGVVTNTSEKTLNVLVSAFVTMEAASGVNQVSARIVRNGNTTDVEAVATTNSTQNNNPTSVPLIGLFTLNPSDTLALYITNDTSTADVVVTNAKLLINLKA